MFGDCAASCDCVSGCGDCCYVCYLGEYIRIFFLFLGLMRGYCNRPLNRNLGIE